VGGTPPLRADRRTEGRGRNPGSEHPSRGRGKEFCRWLCHSVLHAVRKCMCQYILVEGFAGILRGGFLGSSRMISVSQTNVHCRFPRAAPSARPLSHHSYGLRTNRQIRFDSTVAVGSARIPTGHGSCPPVRGHVYAVGHKPVSGVWSRACHARSYARLQDLHELEPRCTSPDTLVFGPLTSHSFPKPVRVRPGARLVHGWPLGIPTFAGSCWSSGLALPASTDAWFRSGASLPSLSDHPQIPRLAANPVAQRFLIGGRGAGRTPATVLDVLVYQGHCYGARLPRRLMLSASERRKSLFGERSQR